MDAKTRAVLKSGYLSCLITLFLAMYLMVEGLHFAGSEMVHTGLKVFVLSTVIGLGIELNNKLKDN